MIFDNIRDASFKRLVRALLIGPPTAIVLVIGGIQHADAQTGLTLEQKSAVMVVVRMLLQKCTDSDTDTLCDNSEIAFFGNLDR